MSFSTKNAFLLAENCQKGPKLTKISHFDQQIVGNNDRFASNVAIFDEKCSFFVSNLLKINISESKRSAQTVCQMYRIYLNLYWMGII